MNALAHSAEHVRDVEMTADMLTVALMGGRSSSELLAWYSRLRGATIEHCICWDCVGARHRIYLADWEGA